MKIVYTMLDPVIVRVLGQWWLLLARVMEFSKRFGNEMIIVAQPHKSEPKWLGCAGEAALGSCQLSLAASARPLTALQLQTLQVTFGNIVTVTLRDLRGVNQGGSR